MCEYCNQTRDGRTRSTTRTFDEVGKASYYTDINIIRVKLGPSGKYVLAIAE